MRSESGEGSVLFCNRDFPRWFLSTRGPHRALIGIGGNIGDVEGRFKRVLRYLENGRRVRPLLTAPLLKNPPFGYTDQPDFLNSLILVETALEPHELLRYLLWVEKRFGRRRSFPNAPRTLDLDIIFFDNRYLKSRRLVLPHPHFAERDSVMIPLRHMSAAALRPRCRP
ncbi:2-amino-4-hydroxy-6-hydroxymethyldihydropteridine diphosphokinase [Hydrogenimonas sp.]